MIDVTSAKPKLNCMWLEAILTLKQSLMSAYSEYALRRDSVFFETRCSNMSLPILQVFAIVMVWLSLQSALHPKFAWKIRNVENNAVWITFKRKYYKLITIEKKNHFHVITFSRIYSMCVNLITKNCTEFIIK